KVHLNLAVCPEAVASFRPTGRTSDLVVTRGASAGRGTLTRALLYLSDGWLRHASENRVNNINILEVYHEIRWNLDGSPPGRCFRRRSSQCASVWYRLAWPGPRSWCTPG